MTSASPTRVDPIGAVPLVSYGEDCACQRVAVAALSQAGRRCDHVFTAVSLTSLAEGFQLVTVGFSLTDRDDAAATLSELNEKLLERMQRERIPLLGSGGVASVSSTA